MKTKTVTMLLIAFAVSGFANQSIAQQTGQQIMEKVYNNPSGEDTQGSLTMTLTNNRGEQRVRTLKQFIRRWEDGEEDHVLRNASRCKKHIVYELELHRWS